ncbi:MAG: class I SAM-dependent methyltransferase, partial [bacterium]
MDQHSSAENISTRLSERIAERIRDNNGSLPFDQYMEMALYEPGLGYYVNGTRKFGESGDFVTAPELSPLFSHCLARQCAEVLSKMEHPVILEFGAGTGIMAAELLLELERLDQLP